MSGLLTTDARTLIENFSAKIKATKKRIRDLNQQIESAARNGGIIITSIEDMQDGLASYSVPPEVILPYLTTELNILKGILANMEAKENRITAIIKE